MRVLIGCEYSGVVRDAFAARGHYAVSCDLLPSESTGGIHLQMDILEVLDNPAKYGEWDIGGFHPHCTFIACSGLHWNKRVPGRQQQTEDALDFVRKLMSANIPQMYLENPIGCISTRIRKPDQTIQPWQFGHDASKATCLWLKGLPKLVPTDILPPPKFTCCGNTLPGGSFILDTKCPTCGGLKKPRPVYANQTDTGQNRLTPSPDRWKERSRTYKGIAQAMAQQWG